MKLGLVHLPSVKEWANSELDDDFDEQPSVLVPEAPRPPVDAVTVVVGVKHNPMKFGKVAKGAPRAAGKSGGAAGGRSAKAWAKRAAKARGSTTDQR